MKLALHQSQLRCNASQWSRRQHRLAGTVASTEGRCVHAALRSVTLPAPPNPLTDRTRNGMPPSGPISFSPRRGMPLRAGYRER